MENKTVYIKQLTFLRFIAAALIVVFHFGQQVKPFDLPVISTFFGEGSIAVSFFFFLSGFVLALNYLHSSALHPIDFWLKRFARIYPIYVIAFLLALVFGMIFQHAFPKGSTVALHLLGIHAWFPGKVIDINFPGWSISVEFFFYAIFPFSIQLFRKLGFVKSGVFVILIWAISVGQHLYFTERIWKPDQPGLDQWVNYFPLWHFNTFLFGMFGGQITLKWRTSVYDSLWVTKWCYLFGIILMIWVLNTDNPIRLKTHNGLLSPLFLLIIVGLALDQSRLTNLLSKKFLILLGNASYSLYILQWPLMLIYSQTIKASQSNEIFFYLYFAILVLISIVSYQYVEKPLRKWIIHRFKSPSIKMR